MNQFVIIPLLVFGTAAYNIGLPKPGPVDPKLPQPRIEISQQLKEDAKLAGTSDFQVKMKLLDKVNQMHRALASSA